MDEFRLSMLQLLILRFDCIEFRSRWKVKKFAEFLAAHGWRIGWKKKNRMIFQSHEQSHEARQVKRNLENSSVVGTHIHINW